MADRNGERVRCVMRGRLRGEVKKRFHHLLYLLLLGASVAADRLLHGRWRVLGGGDLRARASDEDGAAGLPNDERGARVAPYVRLLEGDRIRGVLGDERANGVVD